MSSDWWSFRPCWAGKRLFPEGIDRLKLTLAQTKTVGPDGVQVQIYRQAE